MQNAPATKRLPHVHEKHGDSRIDDFHWLRNRHDPDVLAYLHAENAYTDAVMSPTSGLQTALYDEMLSHIKQTDMSEPYEQHGYFYYSRTSEGQQYAVHCRRNGSLTAPEEMLLDLNALAADATFMALGAFEVSDDGTCLAYALDRTGYRQYELFFKDLVTGAVRGEPIALVNSVAWASDNRTLLYVTEDAVTKRADTVWRYDIDSRRAERVYHEADELFDVAVERTRDGEFILISSEAKDTTEVRFIAADSPAAEPRVFATRVDGVRYELEHRDQRFLIRTNEAAPDFRVCAVSDAEVARDGWIEIVGQRPGMTITAIAAFRDVVVIAGRRDGLASLELLDPGTGVLTPLRFDEPDYVVRLGQNRNFAAPAVRYLYESLVTPPSVVDLDLATGTRTIVKTLEVPGYDPTDYEAERRFIAATDGTPIPVSLVRRRDASRAQPAPMLLYAYGSYGISIEPTFSAARLPLLDRGVTFAIAHVRGGGEYGEAWRLAGNLSRKRTTFTDFIDCARGLIAAGDTSPDRLVIQGGSAGGLLMGAVSNMRPDLFAAVIAQVPFVDVLTTMLDPTLPLTTGEYREWGDPNDAADYAYMRSYSPIDNVVAQAYPAMLIEVAINDSQVPYWEGVKFAAKLRSLTTSTQPILAKVNMGAGHGGASGRYDALAERAFDLAFVLRSVGITH